MGKLKGLWDLIRLDHGIMLVVAIFIGSVIAYGGIPKNPIKLSLAFLTAVFLEISTFALNDYYDYNIDKKNKRFDRPLVRGDLSHKSALLISVFFFPMGIITSYFVNYVCFIIAVFTGIFAIAYDIKLKKIKLIGNYYIAYTMAIPFLFGGVVFSKKIPFIIWTLALVAFFAGVGREILKDIMDISGDKLEKVKSLPMYIGKNKSYIVSSGFFLLAVLISLIPFYINIDSSYYQDYIYLSFVSIPDILFSWISFSIIIKSNPPVKLYRKLTLFALIFGLFAFLVGALI